MLSTLSSRLVLGLFFPLVSSRITSVSIPRSSHHMSNVYVKAACATLDSSVLSGLMFSSTHTLVFLSIHDSLITRCQHHISNASTFFLSAFLIVQVSAPYSAIGNTNAFTSFIVVTSFIPLSFHIVVNPLCLVINASRNINSLPPPRFPHPLSPLQYLR